MRAEAARDVARFARLAIESKDIDPAYPVLRQVQLDTHLTPSQALWSSVCFVAWYRLASSLRAPLEPSMPSDEVLRLGTGIERRGFRTLNAMKRHFGSVLSLSEQHGSLKAWLTHGFGSDPRHNWDTLRSNYGLAWGNGRWATYKLAEVLKEVNYWQIEPTDMGNDGSTGPVAGLHMLYGTPPAAMPKSDRLAMYDFEGLMTQRMLAQHDVQTDIARVETVLCDFHNLARGTYYVGHDIDVMLADLRKPEVPPDVAHQLLAARKRALPHDYLGELRGWPGVDRDRRKWYMNTGEILARPGNTHR